MIWDVFVIIYYIIYLFIIVASVPCVVISYIKLCILRCILLFCYTDLKETIIMFQEDVPDRFNQRPTCFGPGGPLLDVYKS